MSNLLLLQPLRLITSVLGGFGLGVAGLLSPSVIANPISSDRLSTSTDKIETEPSSQVADFCPSFTPFNNTLKPTESPILAETFPPTSTCAKDLAGVKSVLEIAETATEIPIVQEDNPATPPSTIQEAQSVTESEEWHFQFQPYATIPISTYGTATARGRTLDYHLSLGEVLQNLRATASGRFEAWKGRWGFIVDGYYVSLKGIASFQKTATRIPNTIDALNYVLSKDVNTRVQEITDTLNQDVEKLQQIQTLRKRKLLQTLRQKVQTLQETAAQDAQTLRDLDQEIQSFRDTVVAQDEPRLQALDFKLQDFQQLGLNSQALKEIITLNNRDVDRLPREQQLDTKIQNTLTKLNNLEQLQQELTDIKELLEQTRQEIREQRAIKESEVLQKLETDIENVQATLERDINAIKQIQDFSENRLPQEFDANSTTDLQFDQGIYDFALSYHIGELPLYELPEKPSNRTYPLLWFQPIAGVRLNDISIEIDETIGLSLSSSLVSFQGTFQQTFIQGRTWFEPMLGGKIGLQISDPVIFWVRGDVSGFGLAGDTDLSWNVFFGLDWWVRQNISLQFAYHFYEISYKNGSGNKAFGFEQNLNGPYLSATFHF